MKNITMGEFQSMCTVLKPSVYIFDTENQEWCSPNISAKAKLFFSEMMITRSPDMISFKGAGGFLRLEKIKAVYVSENKSPVGTVFHLTCGDFLDCDNDVSYIVIAQQ